MRQIEVSRGEAVQPSRLPPSMLPLMWQLYPGRRYRASDSSFWRIVYHIEASARPSWDLAPLPSPCSGPPGLARLHQEPKQTKERGGSLQRQVFKGSD